MAKSSWNHALVWVSLAGALAGCSTVPDNQRPAAGPPIKIPDATATRDEPIPQAEPPSRSGNPESYVVFGRRYRVRETSEGYRERGIASWYGRDFHGRKTSSGPRFNMFELTAAHKSLPLPTYVRVTNLENGRNTVVKVTDRGPFVGTRLIDLSYAAAVRLGMEERGTAPVEVVALAPYQFLPNLALRRAERRELLARRAPSAKPETGLAESQFARPVPSQPPVRLVLANVEQNPRSTTAPVRRGQADMERKAPPATAKPTNVRPAWAADDRNPGRANVRSSSASPAPKGGEPVAKPSLPAAHANRNGKPVPSRQASESRSMVVRVASLKINRSRGMAD